MIRKEYGTGVKMTTKICAKCGEQKDAEKDYSWSILELRDIQVLFVLKSKFFANPELNKAKYHCVYN